MASEPYRIKAAKFYVDSSMVGTAESGSYRISGNDEMHITADTKVGFGDGDTTTEVNINTIITLEGKTKALTKALLNKAYVTVQVALIDGEIHQIVMRCVEHNFDTDAKTGMLKGSVRFQGGAPQVI